MEDDDTRSAGMVPVKEFLESHNSSRFGMEFGNVPVKAFADRRAWTNDVNSAISVGKVPDIASFL